jgi:hypothetical protein
MTASFLELSSLVGFNSEALLRQVARQSPTLNILLTIK